MSSPTILAAEIGSRFAQVCQLNRSIDYSDARARDAVSVSEHYDWVRVASNLRAARTDVLRSIDTLVWRV